MVRAAYARRLSESALEACKPRVRWKTVGGWDGTEESNEAALVRVVSSAFSFPTV